MTFFHPFSLSTRSLVSLVAHVYVISSFLHATLARMGVVQPNKREWLVHE